MDETGFCAFASIANVARRAIVQENEAEAAILCLTSPDLNSSDPENEGRRLERVQGGWIVLNAEKYRAIVSRANQQEKTRARVAKFRAKTSPQSPQQAESVSSAYTEGSVTSALQPVRSALPTPNPVADAPAPPAGSEKTPPLKCPLQHRAEKLLGKRATTPWSPAELRAWVKAKPVLADATPQDWADIEAWFSLPNPPFRRNGLAALLNNWSDEIFRCRKPENRALVANAPDALAEAEAAARRNAF